MTNSIGVPGVPVLAPDGVSPRNEMTPDGRARPADALEVRQRSEASRRSRPAPLP